MKVRKYMCVTLLFVIIAIVATGCGAAGLGSAYSDLKGSITGNTYDIKFYSNTGVMTMYASGTNIGLEENVVREKTYNSDGDVGYNKTLSSVITITIDGHEVETCGDTVIFAESGLAPDVTFAESYIESEADSLTDNVIIAKTLNKYENFFGKSRVVVIKSQLGDPILAYSGDDVYWAVCQDLPKTTRIYIDGKALYIHRANFQIIDKALLE